MEHLVSRPGAYFMPEGGDTLAPDENSDGCSYPSAEGTVLPESGHGDPPGWVYKNKRLFCPSGGGNRRTSGTVPESTYVYAIQTAGEDSFRNRKEDRSQDTEWNLGKDGSTAGCG